MMDKQYLSYAMYYRRAPQQLNSMLGFVLNQKGGHQETSLIGLMHIAPHVQCSFGPLMGSSLKVAGLWV